MRINKINWEKGSGEMLSFAIVMPIICLIIIAVIGYFQYSFIRQQLEYATYKTVREAVVCENLAEAQNIAQKAVNAYAPKAWLKKGTKIETKLFFTGNGVNGFGMDGSELVENPNSWHKGNFIDCQLTGKYLLLIPFGNKTVTTNLTMMIENEAH